MKHSEVFQKKNQGKIILDIPDISKLKNKNKKNKVFLVGRAGSNCENSGHPYTSRKQQKQHKSMEESKQKRMDWSTTVKETEKARRKKMEKKRQLLNFTTDDRRKSNLSGA